MLKSCVATIFSVVAQYLTYYKSYKYTHLTMEGVECKFGFGRFIIEYIFTFYLLILFQMLNFFSKK
jgi:hypothetical protein